MGKGGAPNIAYSAE